MVSKKITIQPLMGAAVILGLVATAGAVGKPSRALDGASPKEVTAERMDEQSRDALDEMRQVLTRVLEIHQRARESRDVVKLNCVNEKLISVKGLLKISEQSFLTLQEAISKRNMSIARHEFGKISMARRKCTQLAGESETCVGEFAVYSGDTDVKVEIDADKVGGDEFALGGTIETITEAPPPPEVEPPPSASDYL
mgnify:CR=1 FL=1